MKLNYKKIVDKKFESVINGYSPTQVDMFLDDICTDYMKYDKIISQLNLEVTKLKEKIIKLKESPTNEIIVEETLIDINLKNNIV